MGFQLTESEKEQIRYHMGYLLTSFAASVQLGIPRPLQTVFILEDSIALLTNEFACKRVRNILEILCKLEKQLEAATCSLNVQSVGNITFNPGKDRGLFATDLIEREYVRWVNRLADILGAPLYPYSKRFQRQGPGTVLRVRG
jgi:hypothetical protein